LIPGRPIPNLVSILAEQFRLQLNTKKE